jgi:hypothetical protein
MTNDHVFSNILNPVIIQDAIAGASARGHSYRVTTQVQQVIANAFLGVQLNNPTSSFYTARVGRIFGGALTNTAIFLIRDGTVAGGTTLLPYNLNFGYPNASQLFASFSTSLVNPVVGGATFSSIIQTGGPVVDEELGRIVVPPGTRLSILLQNLTNQTNNLAITIGWAETPPAQD